MIAKPKPTKTTAPAKSVPADAVRELAVPYDVVEGRRGGKELAERRLLGFNRPMFARLLATSERNLASIEAGKAPSPAVLKSLTEIRRLLSALTELFDAVTIGEWLKKKNDAFEGRKPLEVIEHGEVDRIWQMIYELRSGGGM